MEEAIKPKITVKTKTKTLTAPYENDIVRSETPIRDNLRYAQKIINPKLYSTLTVDMFSTAENKKEMPSKQLNDYQPRPQNQPVPRFNNNNYIPSTAQKIRKKTVFNPLDKLLLDAIAEADNILMKKSKSYGKDGEKDKEIGGDAQYI